MSNVNFEQASREKLRFSCPRGVLSVEDLWDLPLVNNGKVANTAAGPQAHTNLDDIAKALYKELKDNDESMSFVRPAQQSNAQLQLKFDIVKHIIDVKVAERDAAAVLAEKAKKKQKLMELISRKQDAALEDAPLEDLQKMLTDL
jgi:hypothetical protein